MSTSVCEMLTPERRRFLTETLTRLGYAELGNYVEPLHAAICGDRMAAMMVDQAAASSCACKGKKPAGSLVAQVQAAMQAGGFGVLFGGQSGLTQTTPGRPNLNPDWNCRTTTGDIAECQITEIKADPYPILAVTPTVLAKPAPGLPVEPAGYTWVEIVIPAIDPSSELCVESFSLFDNVANLITPLRFAIQGELIAYDDDGSIVHVFDYAKFTARTGWEITANRCRCLQPPCVCLPAQARARFAALVTDAEAAIIGPATLELYRDPDKIAAVVCGPCPPDNRCNRVVVERCVCQGIAPAVEG